MSRIFGKKIKRWQIITKIAITYDLKNHNVKSVNKNR